MVLFEDFGPVFVVASLAMAGYFAFSLRKIMRKPEEFSEPPGDVYAYSLTAKALSELSKREPNFAPIVRIMENEVTRSGKGKSVLGRRFLARCKELDLSRKVDGTTFGGLYYNYLDLVEIARR